MSSEEELIVPSMAGFEILTKIMIAYLKVGADKEPKTRDDVATVASVSTTTISLNSKFLKSIGVIDGSRGRYKLTPIGTQYAQALDWGRLNEANNLLRELLKDKPITNRTIGYVDINKPVKKETLVGQIAIIAGVRREQRFETGIRGFVDMLVTSGLLEEDKEGNLVTGKTLKKEPPSLRPSEETERLPYLVPGAVPFEPEQRMAFPITLNFSISDETNVENLKKILKAIKEVFLEE
jgi:hypothetical protein